MGILLKSFYERDAAQLARKFLRKILVKKINRQGILWKAKNH